MRVRALLVCVAMLLVVPLGAAASPPEGCAAGSAEQAARALRADAELVTVDSAGGFVSALALEPLVHPGVRFRLVRAGGLWCDARTAFNAAWRLERKPVDAKTIASSFAQVAASAWFDGVSVADVVARGNVVTLRTHARTNGVVAAWTIVVDERGVRSARWTAERFAVRPFEAEWEGITALPGLTRTFTRASDGLLELDQPVVPLSSTPDFEGLTARYVATDGFELVVRMYNTNFSPVLTEDTGVGPIDFARFVRRVSAENYEEFLSWGFQKGWLEDTGSIFIDDALSLACIACVVINQSFNIHMSSQVVPILSALGYSYPDHDKAFSNVVGHEMFHNFQSAYYKPTTGRIMLTGISEGTARMQETLHHYSEVSWQPDSLVYAQDANGCNGYSPAAGPANHSYSSCWFWMPWYEKRGVGAFIDLFTASKDHAHKAGYAELKDTLEQATGESIATDMRYVAQRMLSRRGLTWPAADGTGPAIDWWRELHPWFVPAAEEDNTFEYFVGGGALVGAELPLGGVVTLSSDQGGTAFYEIRDNGVTSSMTPTASGATIAAPAAGERVYVVGIHAPNASTMISIGVDV